MQIHFLSDVLFAAALLNLKVPNFNFVVYFLNQSCEALL